MPISDVLVVGAGLDGLRAALEGARGGARVTILCKRRPGRSSNSVVAAVVRNGTGRTQGLGDLGVLAETLADCRR
jgi:succinate dehydrogenase/fumarate reductase flavoprotein subunit